MNKLDIKSNISHTDWIKKLLKLIGESEKDNEKEYHYSVDKYKYNHTPEQAFRHYKTLIVLDNPQQYNIWLEEYLYKIHNLNYNIVDIQKDIDKIYNEFYQSLSKKEQIKLLEYS